MKGKNSVKKMRISFDLDEVLFVYPKTHKTESKLPFPFDKIYKERLRLGAPELINQLQELGFEVWIYTSSYRTESYIKHLFRLYGVKFDGIINANRHLREVQKDNTTILPQKMPSHYHITLHIDDEPNICAQARQYGFYAYQLDKEDDAWKEKIIEYAQKLRKNL